MKKDIPIRDSPVNKPKRHSGYDTHDTTGVELGITPHCTVAVHGLMLDSSSLLEKNWIGWPHHAVCSVKYFHY